MTTTFKRILSFLFLFFLLIVPTIADSVQAASPFKDVKTNHWAYTEIEWAYNKKIVNGYTDGTFHPEISLTESQLIAILTKLDNVKYTGSLSSSGYYRFFNTKNIPLKGFSNLSYRDQPVTRGQFARIIAAADGLDLTEPYAVQYFYSQELSNGSTAKKTYSDFKPNGVLSRAEAAVFLNRLAKRGAFSLKGLANIPTGKNNSSITLPIGFMNTGTIVFPSPTGEEPEKDVTSSFDARLAAVDIEKTDLISNGVDKAFLTLILKDCYGNPISYDNSLSFTVTSNKGAIISGDKGVWSNTFNTDGNDMTVQITAPRSTSTLKDTVSFKISDHDKSGNTMSCFKKPVTVDLTYTPKAELRINWENYGYQGEMDDYSYVSAEIVRPGGQTITDYNGKVRFKTASTTIDASFVNGVARTSYATKTTGMDEVTAQIIQEDIRYKSEVSSVLNRVHRKDVFNNPYLQLSCPRTDVEIAFVIDSSGSMQRSDPDRYRVTKTQEFISRFNASKNIATKFNSRGSLLGTGNASYVYSTIHNVTQSGGTNIGDGLEKAFSEFTTPNPKVAILVTDGKSSETKILSMLQKARDENIKIFTIGLGDKQQLNESLLQRIANETGGQYYHVNEKIELHEAYQSILTEITCGVPAPSCSYSGIVFTSPTIETSNTDVYMNTYINEGCTDIERVIVRFKSLSGEIDYDLIYRGQNYFAIKKGKYEIIDLSLYTEATFLAYDRFGYLAGSKTVTIRSE